MKRKHSSHRLITCLALPLLLLAACSKESRKAGHLQRAGEYFAAGEYDQAEIEYKNVLRVDPTNHIAIRNRGLMCYEQGRTVQSFLLLTQAKADNPEDLEVSLRLATLQLAVGSRTNARLEALLLAERQPTNENVLLLLADSSFTTNELNETEQRVRDWQSAAGDNAALRLAAGVLKLRRGDRPGSEAEFSQALKLNPKSSPAHAAIASLCLLRNDRTNAEIAFRAAAESSPPRSPHRMRYLEFKIALGEVEAAKQGLEAMVKATPDYLPAILKLAQIALSEQRWAECESLLRSAHVRDPLHLDVIMMIAQMHLARNEPAKAVSELERALTTYPKVPQLHFQLATAHLRQNDLPGAARRLNAALDLQPDLPEAVLLLAELNIRRGDAASAITALTKFTAQRPQFTRAQLLLATAHRARAATAKSPQNLAEALNIYERLNQTYPTNPEPALLAASVLQQQGRRSEARQKLESALTAAPEYLPAVELLVQLDLAETNFVSARQRVEKQITLSPKLAAPHTLLAAVYLAETNLNAAEAALKQAVTLDPEFRPAQALLARVFVAANRHTDALAKLGEMVERNTNDISSLLQIAELHAAATNHAAARDAYERLLRVNPKFFAALNNLAWIYSEHLNDSRRALVLATQAREQAPNDPSTADTLGWILYRNRDFPRALALIQESAGKLSAQPEIQYHLGMVHYTMGEEAAARVALQNAIQLAPTGAWHSDAADHLRILETDPLTADSTTIAWLRQQLSRSPQDPILLSRLAALSEKDGNWKDAAAGYERALTANENFLPAMVRLAQIYADHLDDPARAMTMARRARTLEPDDPAIAATLGNLAALSARTVADHQWAFSLLQESAQKLPDRADLLINLGLAAFKLGRLDEAAVAMQNALKITPRSPRSGEAETFLRLNTLARDPVAAVAAANEVAQVLARQPGYPPGLWVQGLIEEQRGNYPAARDLYEKLMTLAPGFTPANKPLATLYLTRLNDSAKAYDHAVKAREAYPQDPAVARTLGLITYKRSDFSRAVTLLGEAVRAFPEDADVRYHLGLSQNRLKQTAESKANLTKALALAPDSALAAEAKKQLEEMK